MHKFQKGDIDYHEDLNNNFDETVKVSGDNQTILGTKNFQDGLLINGVSLLDVFYPVGSIYQSTVATDPKSFMGGTWERIKGRVLVGVNESETEFATVSKTGGSKTHTHDLGSGAAYAQLKISSSEIASKNMTYAAEWSVNTKNSSNMTFAAGTGMATGGVNVVGNSDAQSNLQPYQTVYMWKRTA